MPSEESATADVAIVGGGPAGAALAAQLARRGVETVVFERLREPRWRAAGVYSSPLTRDRLRGLGLAETDVERLIRPIGTMVVETVDGTAACRLDYPPPDTACGIDRVRLERALLAHARRAGADVREGAVVRGVRLSTDGPHLIVSDAGGRAGSSTSAAWRARLVVGADGPTSLVGRAAGVAMTNRWFRRVGVTAHRLEPAGSGAQDPAEAHMLIGAGWYCGIAPVPGRRANIGLVIGEGRFRRQLAAGRRLADVLDDALRAMPAMHAAWADAPATDDVQAALPLTHRVRRAAGDDFLLVGDAAGFIDPLSGDGLHRALVSAELATSAIVRRLGGEHSAMSDYDQRLRARFRSKDYLSWLLQLFLFRPRLAGHALRRLASRPGDARHLALGLADVVPASALLDPRFLARLLVA